MEVPEWRDGFVGCALIEGVCSCLSLTPSVRRFPLSAPLVLCILLHGRCRTYERRFMHETPLI